MELGAVVIPARGDLAITAIQGQTLARDASSALAPLYSSSPILGNDLLQSWTERVRSLGVPSIWLASSPRDESVSCSTLERLSRQKIERLLVIELKSYAEMDLADLLQFHCERTNQVTEAHDGRGPLGVRLMDHPDTYEQTEPYSTSITEAPTAAYQFRGYAKRIVSARERQDLVRDALTGACAMRPLGAQIDEQVWMGEDVRLDGSVRIIGPAYIGARTSIRAGATIGPFASVEQDCVIDCGTTVERSTVLPHTYLSTGLRIRNALVDGGYLEHLEWGAVADLQPAGLGGRIQRRESQKHSFELKSADFPSAAQAFSAKDSENSSSAAHQWIRVQL